VGWFDRLKKGRRKASPASPLSFEEAPGGEASVRAPIVRDGRAAKRSGVKDFPRFEVTAGDQLGHRLSDQFASARFRLRGAFTPSQPVVGRRMFAGRTNTLTTLIRAIEDERLHVIIYGERGIGKTSLMHVLAEAAREARYLVSYVSCGASSNFDETFRAFAANVPLLYHSGYGATSPEAERGATLADLLPDAPVSVRFASDLAAKVVGTRALIVLDEFDRVESAEFRLQIAEFLKNLSDRSVRVQLLVAGVAANLTELLAHIPSIQRSIFALEVPRMTEAEVRQLVKNGEEICGVQFNEAAVSFIVSAAGGLPYMASLLGQHAGLKAISDSRLVVTSHDITTAVAEALLELKGRISKRSQLQIAACIQDGSHKILSSLSGFAQLGGGSFTLNDISSVASSVELANRYRALIAKLADEAVLIQRQDDEFGVSYRFLEGSVPIYLWLLAAQTRLLESQEAPANTTQRRGASVAV
jgi:Cdc6-like AAA superfamily ATPase